MPNRRRLKSSSSLTDARPLEFTEIITILHKWGIHTLGDLAALQPDQLTARLGPVALRLWNQATGRATRLLRLVRPAEVFREEIEFDYEVETVEPVLFILQRFLEQLTRRLGALYLLACELTLGLTFTDKTSYQHRFQIPDPTNSIELLFRLLQTHLENFRTAHPIVAVALEAQPARPGEQQFRFFETPLRDPGRLHETLTRLTGLFGRERVGRPLREDSHRPDAFHLDPFIWDMRQTSDDLPNNKETLRFGPALRRLRLGSSSSPEEAVVEQQGPYPASGNWWDEKWWQRTEWDLELASGRVCRCQEIRDGWQVEGIYD